MYWTPHTIHIHKERAHTGISGNEMADTLANKKTLKDKPEETPHIHIAHATPYWLATSPTPTHDGAIRNLHTFITKDHENWKATLAKKIPIRSQMALKCRNQSKAL